MFNVEVAYALAGRLLAVDLQWWCHLVFLVEVRRACVFLGGNEEVGPYHVMNDVADSDHLGLGGDVGVHLLFLVEIYNGAFAKGHAAICVDLEVRMDGKGCVNPPVDEAQVGYLEGGAQAGVLFEVIQQVAKLGPVVFARVFDVGCEEGEDRMVVAAQSCHKEEDLYDHAVEDLHLLFGEEVA